MARKSCFSPLPACQIPVTRKLIFESLQFGNVSNEEKIKFKGSFFFAHRNSYRCFLCVNNPLTMPFRKFMAKGLPSISGPPYVLIIIFLCHFFFFLVAAADVFLWRNKKISASVLGGATALWVFFELLEYHLVTLVCHILILSLAVLFLWSNVSTFINK